MSKRWLLPVLALLLVALGPLHAARAVPSRQIGPPTLTIADQIPSPPNTQVDVPVTFASGENNIASISMSIDFNQNLLSFDPTDANLDGIPDNILFSVPAGFTYSGNYNANRTDGEIVIAILYFGSPLQALPDGVLVTLRLTAGSPPFTQNAFVGFSAATPPSFGNTSGQTVTGASEDGSVRILVPSTGTPSATLSPTPTNTPTNTATSTSTNTPTNTNTPTSTLTPTATHTPTATNTLPPDVTPSATHTATNTATRTATATSTNTPAATASATSGPSPTATATLLPGVTPSATRTATATRTRTPTATFTPGPSPTTAGGAILIGQRLVDATPGYGDTTVLVDGTPAAQTQEEGWFVVLNPLPGLRTVELRYPGALPSRGLFNVPNGKVVFLGATKLVLGDVYANNIIDKVDIDLVRAAQGRCTGQQSYQAFLDLNKDGCIDGVDLTIVVTNEGIVGPTRWTVSPP